MTTLEKINLVTATAVSSTNQSKPVTESGSVQARQGNASPGNELPGGNKAGEINDPSKAELDQAVKNVAGYVQDITRELHFSVDEDLGRFVVKVMDEKTGEIVRQIPTEDMLELSKTLNEVKERTSKGMLFDGDA